MEKKSNISFVALEGSSTAEMLMIDLISSRGKKEVVGFEPMKLAAPRIARTVADKIV